MKHVMIYTLLAMVAAGCVSGCGYKGKLKTPSQAAQDKAEKESKAAKKREDAIKQENEQQ
jgi:predicted small lipoprotein YifL